MFTYTFIKIHLSFAKNIERFIAPISMVFFLKLLFPNASLRYNKKLDYFSYIIIYYYDMVLFRDRVSYQEKNHESRSF